MPAIKKSPLTKAQLEALLKAKSKKPTLKLSPTQKYAEIVRVHEKRFRHKLRKFHFKAIEHDDKIFLFDGLGATIDVISGVDIKTLQKAREVSRELFIETPEFERQGGYKFDFYKDNLVRIDLSLGFLV